jgi:outer membrane receptor protein involved in Fe transport
VKLNAASVGNDTYRLVKTYDNGAYLGTLTPSSILNSNLKPEIATSYEVGVAYSFLRKLH